MYNPNDGQDSRDSSEDRSPVRQSSSVRISRRSAPGGGSQSRVSLSRTGNTTSRGGSNSARARRPTPVAARRRRVADDYDEDYFDDDDEDAARGGNLSSSRRQRGARTNTSASATFDRNQGAATATYRRYSSPANPNDLTWYDRLMPDFVLNMTAPLTGYESRLNLDVEDEEYEILERERLRRNRRIRRRLLTLMFLATAGAVVMYTRGKLMRKVGVKLAVNNMKHRIEDGLVKSIHETMGK